MQYPRKKRPRKISDAVFRGKKSAYSFQVFPIAADIDDTPAVFIIARRRTDKLGHGHQSAVCIGETTSITAELKKHKRAKCVKNNEPNVVCVLEEENPSARAGVLEDLTAARKFGCIQNVYDFTIKPKSYERPKASRPAKRVVPEIVVDKKPAPTKGKASRLPAGKAAAGKEVSKSGKKSKPGLRPVTAKPPKRVRANAAKPPARPAVAVPDFSKRKPAATAVRSKSKPASIAKKPLVKALPATRAKSARPVPVPVPAAKRSSAKRVASSKQAAVTTKVVKRQPAVKPKSSAAKTVKKRTVVKPAAVQPKRGKTAAAKKATTAKAKPTVKSKAPVKRAATSGTRSRVPSGVDSNGRQHRLSKPEKSVSKRAKSRTDSKLGTRRKAAA